MFPRAILHVSLSLLEDSKVTDWGDCIGVGTAVVSLVPFGENETMEGFLSFFSLLRIFGRIFIVHEEEGKVNIHQQCWIYLLTVD